MSSWSEYLGSIELMAFPWNQENYALCNGALVPIAQNSALASLIGSTWGGDGRVTFGLPNLQGRVPVGQGQQPGASLYGIGEAGGAEQVTLTAGNLPEHVHDVSLGGSGTGTWAVAQGSTGTPSGVQASTAPAGQNQPFTVMQPYQAVNYIIAVDGIYPVRY